MIENVAKKMNCRFLRNEKLAKYTSFKIGGEADLLIFVNSYESVAELIVACKKYDIPYFVLGKGSNVLISNQGISGVVFLFGEDFSQIKFLPDDKIYCQAGAMLSKLSFNAYKKGFTGLEFAHGIPGSVGGAVFMNAGAYGGEIYDVIESVVAVDLLGNVKTFEKDELQFSYRHSIFCENNYVILSAIFELKKGDNKEIKAKMDEFACKRKEKQPLEFPSAGSTFKRPDGAFAGKLIEDCGLKGKKNGGAMVSDKHCGFVVNYDNATFFDVKELIEFIQKEVLEQTGYKLETEVKIIE